MMATIGHRIQPGVPIYLISDLVPSPLPWPLLDRGELPWTFDGR